MTFDEILGNNIRQKRTELGLSQEDLARKLGYSGKSMISMIECGRRALNASQLTPMAKALSCSRDDLLDGTEPDEQLSDLFDLLDPEEQKEILEQLLTLTAKRRKG